MLAYSHYRANQMATCISQDVPTYFHAVQRSRLPMVTMPLDRGLSDTNVGEANHQYCSKKRRNWRFLNHPSPCQTYGLKWSGMVSSSPQNPSQHRIKDYGMGFLLVQARVGSRV
ncbi:hypothetical protein [Scytonema sp. PRP1]|uniref:hypothetical protein n=1 Tax=Scytonema sp. PRP1 TaxID=3120513 RepID=UPI002FCFBA25